MGAKKSKGKNVGAKTSQRWEMKNHNGSLFEITLTGIQSKLTI